MIIVGITGSMAMGKSTLVTLLKRTHKYPIFDADAEIKKLYLMPEVLKKIATLTPELVQDGQIQRAALSKFILASPRNILALEAVLYPELAKARQDFLAKNKRLGIKLVFLDIPLLIEKQMQALCDYIVVVQCPEWLQQKRLDWRHGQSSELKKLLLQQQLPSSDKVKHADFVVQTGLNRYYAKRQLDTLLKMILFHD